MAIVIRLGPLPLQSRLAARTAELERIFGTTVQMIGTRTLGCLLSLELQYGSTYGRQRAEGTPAQHPVGELDIEGVLQGKHDIDVGM